MVWGGGHCSGLVEWRDSTPILTFPLQGGRSEPTARGKGRTCCKGGRGDHPGAFGPLCSFELPDVRVVALLFQCPYVHSLLHPQPQTSTIAQ
jgi:hypothetical protein